MQCAVAEQCAKCAPVCRRRQREGGGSAGLALVGGGELGFWVFTSVGKVGGSVCAARTFLHFLTHPPMVAETIFSQKRGEEGVRGNALA